MNCPICGHKMKLMQVEHAKPKFAPPTVRRRYACLGGCGRTETVAVPAVEPTRG